MNIVKTTTKDGLLLHGLYSNTSDKNTIIIHIHGMGGDFYSGTLIPYMFEKYLENNIAFLAGENRGTHTITTFNTSSGEKNIGDAYEIFEESVNDIQAWIDYAIELGYSKIWLQSHSLGPSKVAYYISQVQPTNITGLIWLSPSDMIGLVHDPIGLEDHKILYPEALKLVSEGKGNQLLSHLLWGSKILSAQTYLNFHSDTSNTAIFNYWNQDLGWKVVNNVYLPVLAITGTKDDGIEPVMNPIEAMNILERELKNSPKVLTRVYENAEHSFEGFESNILEDVLSFI